MRGSREREKRRRPVPQIFTMLTFSLSLSSNLSVRLFCTCCAREQLPRSAPQLATPLSRRQICEQYSDSFETARQAMISHRISQHQREEAKAARPITPWRCSSSFCSSCWRSQSVDFIHRAGQKRRHKLMAIILSNLNRFSKFCHCQIL